MRLLTTIEEWPIDPRYGPLGTAAQRVAALAADGSTILRWGLIGRQQSTILVELALAEGLPHHAGIPLRGGDGFLVRPGDLRTVIIIPTGVGATLGGFIADAGPFVRAVESVSMVTIVHPNVVNGADFYAASHSTVYVDGYTLDQFLLGNLRLGGTLCRRIGIVIESMPAQDVTRILNAANAVSAIYGIDIVGYDVIERPVRAHVSRSRYGHFTGEVEDPEIILESVTRLKTAGANAIAVVTNCGGVTDTDWMSHYLHGGPNPIGALEALVSRFITHATGLIAAHAPANVAVASARAVVVDPRAAGEVASGTGLPCVLLGLARSPVVSREVGLAVSDLTAVIVPYGCAGGIPAWGAHQAAVRIVAVRSNTCVVGVPADQIGIDAVIVDSAAEAVAWLVCTRAGVAWSHIAGPAKAIAPVNGIGARHELGTG